MRKYSSLIILFFCATDLFGQQGTLDSTQTLQPVLIQAYATNLEWIDVPASVGVLKTSDLVRFSPASILPAMNTIPGVKMEERSPGSYRFSMRGSLLRSPFGVRNVKVYWNGIPITDAGGNTYLNLLDFNAIGGIELIKGPGGSLYGAGTGGVVLLRSPQVRNDELEVSTTLGSYGLNRFQFAAQQHTEKFNLRIGYARQHYDGYRDQTSMRKDALNADLRWLLSSNTTLSTTLFYTDLWYQTPGGLTQAQYDANPEQARPPAGPARGTVEQKATIYNKSPFAGINLEHDWTEHWTSNVNAYVSFTDFENPTFRNYEVRKEANAGVRNENVYRFGKKIVHGKLITGVEYQSLKSPIQVYDNEYGVKGNRQTDDELRSKNLLLFSQLELQLPLNFSVTLGGSVNFVDVSFARTYPTIFESERNIEPSFSPRIAILNKITPAMSVYASASRGFSPPSIAELYPSRGIFDTTIQPEYGNNFEVGLRGNKLWKTFTYDLTAYQFTLENTLVSRTDPSLPGAPEYFVNAGSTNQRGVEALLFWTPVEHSSRFISDFKIWNSYTYNDYRFGKYTQGSSDYTGNLLTGVTPVQNSTGVDLTLRNAVYANVTGTYVDHVPLNDGNTVFANEYYLLGARVGAKIKTGITSQLEIYAGIDNALNKKYSLGNDLNAFGGRFFNAAAPRNYFAGLRFNFSRPKA